MDSKIQFSLRGTRFGIETHLKENNKTGWEFEKSVLSRFFYNNKLDSTNLSIVESNFLSLRKLFPYEIRIVIINADEVILLEKDNTQQFPYVIKDFVSKLGFDTVVSTRATAIVKANNYQEDVINASVIKTILQKISLRKDFSGITIFTGEMIWSGWFDTFTLLSFLLENDNLSAYFTLDSYAVWHHTILELKKDNHIKSYSKKLFEADLTLINNAGKKKEIPLGKFEIIKGKESKILHNIESNFNFYDLKKTGFEILENNNFLARCLLIKNKRTAKISESIYKNKQKLFQSSCGKYVEYSYPPSSYFKIKNGNVLLEFAKGVVLKNGLKGQVYKNDTRIEVCKPIVEYINMHDGATVLVTKDQLVTTGEIVYKYKLGNNYRLFSTTKSGKVSEEFLDKGILSIEIDKRIDTITINFSGNVKFLQEANKLLINTNYYEVPIFNNKYQRNIAGHLIDFEIKNVTELENYAFNIIPYIRSQLSEQITECNLFKTGRVPAVLVSSRKFLKPEQMKFFNENNVSLVFLDEHSNNANLEIEKIIGHSIGRYVEIREYSMLIPIDNEDFYQKIEKGINNKHSLTKGALVKFFNYQSDFLYGKIEKSLHGDKLDNYLINMPDGIYEGHPANIIIV